MLSIKIAEQRFLTCSYRARSLLRARLGLSIPPDFSLFWFPDDFRFLSAAFPARHFCCRIVFRFAAGFRSPTVRGCCARAIRQQSRAAELVGRAHAGFDGSAHWPSASSHEGELQSSRRNCRPHRSNTRRRLSFRMAKIRTASALRNNCLSCHNARRKYFFRVADFESPADCAALSRSQLR